MNARWIVEHTKPDFKPANLALLGLTHWDQCQAQTLHYQSLPWQTPTTRDFQGISKAPQTSTHFTTNSEGYPVAFYSKLVTTSASIWQMISLRSLGYHPTQCNIWNHQAEVLREDSGQKAYFIAHNSYLDFHGSIHLIISYISIRWVSKVLFTTWNLKSR